jgi:hydrogenase maturation factor
VLVHAGFAIGRITAEEAATHHLLIATAREPRQPGEPRERGEM